LDGRSRLQLGHLIAQARHLLLQSHRLFVGGVHEELEFRDAVAEPLEVSDAGAECSDGLGGGNAEHVGDVLSDEVRAPGYGGSRRARYNCLRARLRWLGDGG
jgi:hypothetical protein